LQTYTCDLFARSTERSLSGFEGAFFPTAIADGPAMPRTHTEPLLSLSPGGLNPASDGRVRTGQCFLTLYTS
jgi:hypothetical protein